MRGCAGPSFISFTIFSHASGSETSAAIFERAIRRPYAETLAQNTSELISATSTKIDAAINVIYQMTVFVSSIILTGGIFLFLVFHSPLISCLILFSFGGIYLCIGKLFSKTLIRTGDLISSHQTALMRTQQETLGGVREIIMGDLFNQAGAKFKAIDAELRHYQGLSHFIAASPRFVIEALILIVAATFLATFGKSIDSSQVLQSSGRWRWGRKGHCLRCRRSFRGAVWFLPKVDLRLALEFLKLPTPIKDEVDAVLPFSKFGLKKFNFLIWRM